jgi:hypothetical protein
VLPGAATEFAGGRPTLHGLFTFGALALALVRRACGGDPARLRALSGRLSGACHPGDTLVHEGWRVDGSAWVAVVRAAATGHPVLSHVRARCREPGSAAREA